MIAVSAASDGEAFFARTRRVGRGPIGPEVCSSRSVSAGSGVTDSIGCAMSLSADGSAGASVATGGSGSGPGSLGPELGHWA